MDNLKLVFIKGDYRCYQSDFDFRVYRVTKFPKYTRSVLVDTVATEADAFELVCDLLAMEDIENE